MSEQKQLFDKPMDELREVFVRARFAEQAVFGRADAETWFAKQRYAERPQEKTWVRFLGRGSVQPWADRDFFDLRTHATSLGVLNARFGSVGDADAYGPIYDRLAFASSGRDLNRVLYSGNAGLLYVENHIHGPMFVIREEWGKGGGVTISRVRSRSENPGARTILGVVFSEWQHGRPMWRSARASLCRAFEGEIVDERERAEHDFDTAVAVSADGTQIVHADYVVVVESTGAYEAKAVAYPASAFQEKLLRSPKMERESCRFDLSDERATDDIARITYALSHPGDPLSTRGSLGHELSPYNHNGWRLASGHHLLQRLVDYQLRDGSKKELRERKFLLTTRDFCPDPLPDGGVEVTV